MQLMWFLGMCGFYSCFVPHFVAITAPLTNQFQKDVKWMWSEMCQEALTQVKAVLSAPQC